MPQNWHDSNAKNENFLIKYFNIRIFPRLYNNNFIISSDMVSILKVFNNYQLQYYTNGYTVIGSQVEYFSKSHATVGLFFNAEVAGIINFYDELPVKPNSVYPGGGFPVLNFHVNQFSDIMNVIRYEKPLYLRLNTDNWYGSISTTAEPVGEEES